ncbi:hypothetical protein D3C85_1899040 [compost metagenome]
MIDQLGLDLENKLYMAKFGCDNNTEWHGYPVHPRNADIPPEKVLESWRCSNIITKKSKLEIMRGKFRG